MCRHYHIHAMLSYPRPIYTLFKREPPYQLLRISCFCCNRMEIPFRIPTTGSATFNVITGTRNDTWRYLQSKVMSLPPLQLNSLCSFNTTHATHLFCSPARQFTGMKQEEELRNGGRETKREELHEIDLWKMVQAVFVKTQK